MQPGPKPKRTEDLDEDSTWRAKREAETTYADGGNVTIPVPDEDWHPIAYRLFESMRESGAARFYESTDWAVLYSFCEDLSYYKKQGRRSAQMLSAINQILTSLLLTEADRRRAKIELQADNREVVEETSESAAILQLREYMEKRNGSTDF